MSEIRKYVVVDADDQEGDYEFASFDEAREAAVKQGQSAVIVRVYEYSDSELCWTSTGADTWPPATND